MNDNELRERIGDAFAVEPPRPGFEARMRSALMSPPPRRSAAVRWPLEAAGGLIAVVVVVALTLTHLIVNQGQPVASPSSVPGVVPWANLPAANVAQPFTKPGVPPCHAAQLKFELNGQYINSGPKDTTFWTIAITNMTAGQCFVGPMMDITFASAQGPLKMTRRSWPGDIVYLDQGRRAVGEVDLGPCHDPRITRMTFSPGQGLGSVSLNPGPGGGWGTPCPDKPETYFVELYADTNQGGYLPMTETGIQAPASARPGERLRFLVTISDISQWDRGSHIAGSHGPTPSPVTWSPCPTYHLELEGVEGTFHTYRLNCAAARTIAPGESETFEMFIDVPSEAKPGPATLVWSIDGSPAQWARATAFVPVTS